MSEYLKNIKEEENGFVNKLLERQKEAMFDMYNDYNRPMDRLAVQKQIIISNVVKNFEKAGTYSEIDFINLTDIKRIPDDLPGLMADYQNRHGLYAFIKLIDNNSHLVRALISEYLNCSCQKKNAEDFEKLNPVQRTYIEEIGFYFDRQATLLKPKQLELEFKY